MRPFPGRKVRENGRITKQSAKIKRETREYFDCTIHMPLSECHLQVAT